MFGDLHRRRPRRRALAAWSIGLVAILCIGVTLEGVGAVGPDISVPDPVRSNLRLVLEPAFALPDGEDLRMMKLTHSGDGSGRRFVGTMGGQIWQVDADGSVAASPYVDLDVLVPSVFGGDTTAFTTLSYFAFHPDFHRPGAPGEGRLFVSYRGATVATPTYSMTAFGAAPTPGRELHYTVAEIDLRGGAPGPTDYREVLRLDYWQPGHAIGDLEFIAGTEPDDADHGLLYIGSGDGTNGGSLRLAPWSQELGNPFGKVLRIDPLQDGASAYSVPSSNPFTTVAGAAPEIYALGLRNPQTLTSGVAGQMYAGEIGHDHIEELNVVTAGANFGWSTYEGVGQESTDPLMHGPHVPPAASYDHDLPSQQVTAPAVPAVFNTALVAGPVYRGRAAPLLTGRLLFGDLARGRVFSVSAEGLDTAAERVSDAPVQEHLLQIADTEVVLNTLVHPSGTRADLRFGEDEAGDVYVLNKHNGVGYRIVDAVEDPPVGACPTSMAFTTNGTGMLFSDSAGDVMATGTAIGDGSAPALRPGERVVAIVPTRRGAGYHLLTSMGRALPSGDAASLGDVAHLDLNGEIVAARTKNDGYYLLGLDGGVFALGGAPFRGSTGSLSLNSPVNSMMVTSSGYRLAAGDGGVFAFGSSFRGSMGGVALAGEVIGIDGTDDGYWLAGRDGGVFSFGLPFHGSRGGVATAPILAFAAHPGGGGYSMLASDGVVYHFGLPAQWFGDQQRMC